MKLTIVSGTNRQDNLSLLVARRCQEMLSDMGCAAELLSLDQLPPSLAFSYLDNPRTGEFAWIQAMVDQTTHFLFVVPEYNGSIPGVLKLFIDACDYPGSFRGKSAAMVGIAAGERGNEVGLSHLRDILGFFGMSVFPQSLTLGRIRQKVQRGGGFQDQRVEADLEGMLRAFHSHFVKQEN